MLAELLSLGPRLRPQRTIAIMGAFRSGTNFVRYLLEQNFRCRVRSDYYGWKHGPVPICTKSSGLRRTGIPVVAVSKDPFAFCASLHRYLVKDGLNLLTAQDWDTFLRSPITIFDRRIGRSPQLRLANPLKYYNLLYWNLLTLPEKAFRRLHLRYDEVVADPMGQAHAVADALGLRRRRSKFDAPSGTMSRASDKLLDLKPRTAKELSFDPVPHLERRYLDDFSEEQRAFVASQTDRGLMDRMGYDVESLAKGRVTPEPIAGVS